jgi:hypothetical protein
MRIHLESMTDEMIALDREHWTSDHQIIRDFPGCRKYPEVILIPGLVGN